MLMLMTPGADRTAYFEELTRLAAVAGEPSPEEWAAVMRRHDNVMVRDHDSCSGSAN